MYVGTHHVDTVYAPVEALLEGLGAAEHDKGLLGHGLLTAGIAVDHTEQHAAREGMGLKDTYGLLQGVGRKPVVTVEKGDIGTRGMP